MGIEPTHQLVTGALVLKGIKRRNLHALEARTIPCNPFIINGFPVFPVSAEIGEKRSHPERHRHKIVIKSACSEIDDRWTHISVPGQSNGKPLYAVMFHFTLFGWDSPILRSHGGIRPISPAL